MCIWKYAFDYPESESGGHSHSDLHLTKVDEEQDEENEEEIIGLDSNLWGPGLCSAGSSWSLG